MNCGTRFFALLRGSRQVLRQFRSKPREVKAEERPEIRKSKEKKQSPEFAPEEVAEQFEIKFIARTIKDLWKPAAFTAGVCGCCFVGASIWQYERRRQFKDSILNLNWGYRERKRGQTRRELNEWWQSLSDGKRAAVSIIGINALVLLAWKLPVLHPVLFRYFTSSFYGEKFLSPMILSAFSHYSLIHCGLNMFVLWSFVPNMTDQFMGMEQFVGFYISGATMASLGGHIFRAFTGTRSFGLGASGAILASLMYTCYKIPDARIQIVFLPFFTFSAMSAIYGILAMDAIGLVVGWRMFDHAAHLGGSLFGLWYAAYGEACWKRYHKAVQQKWKNLKAD